MSYRSKNKSISIGDTWHLSDGNKVQAFFLQYQQKNTPPAGKEYGAIGRAESEDLIVWKTLPSAVYPGGKGTYDDLEIWTGCTIADNGKHYLFYTSRSSLKPQYSISVAISDDGKTYEKYEGNPLFTPDERYYVGVNSPLHLVYHGNWGFNSYDLRDMCVVKDEDKGCYWGYFAARISSDDVAETSVIGLARSTDLLHWEQLPPCFVPNRYHCIETPDVFFMNGKWYLLCLAGNVYGQRRYGKEKLQYGRITVYAVADSQEGPYYETGDNLLVSTINQGAACAKTVEHKGKRYMFYTEVFQEKDHDDQLFMSLPKELKCENGKLFLGYYEGIDKYAESDLSLSICDAVKNDGSYGTLGKWEGDGQGIIGETRHDWSILPFSINANEFVFEADIENVSAEEVGLVFGMGDNICSGAQVVLLDYLTDTVVQAKMCTFVTEEAREWKLSDKISLKIVVVGMTAEVYINDVYVMHYLTYYGNGKVGLYVEKGKAIFNNVRFRTLSNIEND